MKFMMIRSSTMYRLSFVHKMCHFSFLPSLISLESYLTAPEAELLTMGTIALSQNTMYNLPMTGLAFNCNAGPGPDFELGTFR